MKAIDDEDRDVPLAQDLFHVMGVVKLAPLLANKRGLNPELGSIAGKLGFKMIGLQDVSVRFFPALFFL